MADGDVVRVFRFSALRNLERKLEVTGIPGNSGKIRGQRCGASFPIHGIDRKMIETKGIRSAREFREN